jgi:hypothetical protein
MENREAIEYINWMRDKFITNKPLEAFDMAISALEKQEQDRWISVKDRLPEYEKEVLTCNDNGDMSVGYLYSPGFGHADRWHVDFTSSPVYHIVAWRPLPKAYQEDTNG